jgi:hypothetical protein
MKFRMIFGAEKKNIAFFFNYFSYWKYGLFDLS